MSFSVFCIALSVLHFLCSPAWSSQSSITHSLYIRPPLTPSNSRDVDRYSNPASDGSDAESTADPVEQRSHAYDENGDLVLIVGPQAEGSFRVCSRTLARASVVFEKMLFGVFAESRSRYHSEDYWEIKLPDDDADSMEIFLNIIHGRPADVPRTLALRALWPYMSDALCTSRSIWLGGCHEQAQF